MKDNFFEKKKILKIALTLLGIFTVGCVILESSTERNKSKFPEDTRVDRSFVTGQPCDAPCWYKLRLEESTIDDIRATLAQLSFIDQSTLFEWSIGTDGSKLGFYFNCVYYSPPDYCGELVTEKGKLSRVVMAVRYPLTLELAIDRLGVPEFYTVDTSSTESNCILSIYWPEKDIVAVVEENTRKKHCSEIKNESIDLDLQVVSLIYLNIDSRVQQNYETRPWPDSAP